MFVRFKSFAGILTVKRKEFTIGDIYLARLVKREELERGIERKGEKKEKNKPSSRFMYAYHKRRTVGNCVPGGECCGATRVNNTVFFQKVSAALRSLKGRKAQ